MYLRVGEGWGRVKKDVFSKKGGAVTVGNYLNPGSIEFQEGYQHGTHTCNGKGISLSGKELKYTEKNRCLIIINSGNNF